MTKTEIKSMFPNLPNAIVWLIDKAEHAYSTEGETAGECWQFRGNLPFRMQTELRKFMECKSSNGDHSRTLAMTDNLYINTVCKLPVYKGSNRVFFGIEFLSY